MAICTIRIRMLVVWERHTEFRDKAFALRGREEIFTQTRKRPARRVDGCRFYMAVGTELWNWSLACEEVLPVAIQASCMFGKFSYIRKRSVALTNFLPVLSGKLVTCTARKLFFCNVSGMRKVRRTQLHSHDDYQKWD